RFWNYFARFRHRSNGCSRRIIISHNSRSCITCLGWNFGLISGTALIVDSTEPEIRAKTQGTIDVFIALGGAAGGSLSGMVVAGSSFEMLSLAGAILSLILVPIVVWSKKSVKKPSLKKKAI